MSAQSISEISFPVILIADDDSDDRLMVGDALKQSGFKGRPVFVEDGEGVLDYLHGRGRFRQGDYPLPRLILLDLNMPRKTGIEVLREMKADGRFEHVPVVVFTTSQDEEDMQQSYALGVNSFITKPVSYDALVHMMEILGKYWFEIVQLPARQSVR